MRWPITVLCALSLRCVELVDVSAPRDVTGAPCEHVGGTRPCYDGPPATRRVGACRDGVHRCGADRRWSPCAGAVLPRPEGQCNYRDDDCDGTVDEDVIYEEIPRTRFTMRHHLPVGIPLVARWQDHIVAAWSVGVHEANWTEHLRWITVGVGVADGSFPIVGEATLQRQAPIETHGIFVREDPKGGGAMAVVQGAIPAYACTTSTPPRPTSQCGELFYTYPVGGAEAPQPALVTRDGGSRAAVFAGDLLLLPDSGGDRTQLRSLDPETFAVMSEPTLVPIPLDETNGFLRGVRLGDRVLWVTIIADALWRVETDLRGALTAHLEPAPLGLGGAGLADLERVGDSLWALVDSAAGQRVVRWPLDATDSLTVIDVGIGSSGALSYAPDANQVYLCTVGLGTASIQRLSVTGRLLPFPRPATLQVDADTRCEVAATAHGAFMVTRQHHDGIMTWARYGCPNTCPPE